MLSDEEKLILHKLIAADDASFTDLVRIAGLDPSKDFRGANLRKVDFTGCNLTGYDFTGTDMSGSDLSGAYLGDANFTQAVTQGTKWPESDHPGYKAANLAVFQKSVIGAMLRDLYNRGTALALLPIGIGASRILEEVVCNVIATRKPVLVILQTRLEADQFLKTMSLRLDVRIRKKRSIETRPYPGIDVTELGDRLMVMVANREEQDNAVRMGAFDNVSRFEAVFVTSVDAAEQISWAVKAAGQGPMLACIARDPVFDRRIQSRRNGQILEIFGTPSIEIDLRQMVDEGYIQRAEIIRVQTNRYALMPEQRKQSSREISGYVSLSEEVNAHASAILEIYNSNPSPGLFVLTFDSEMLIESLRKQSGFAPEVFYHCNAKSRIKFNKKLANIDGRIIVASTMTSTVQQAIQHPRVVVTSELPQSDIMKLAFRPPSFSGTPFYIFDLASFFEDIYEFTDTYMMDLKTPRF